MPAGNDAKAAAHELADKFGRGDARGEDLIGAVKRPYHDLEKRQITLLGRIQNLAKDEELSERIDLDVLAAAVEVEKIEAAAVRGDAISYVAVDKMDGRTFRGAILLSELEDAVIEEEEEEPEAADVAPEPKPKPQAKARRSRGKAKGTTRKRTTKASSK